MEVLIQHPNKLIRADVASSCSHGWVDDKLDSGMRECNLMEDVGSKFVDDIVLLLPLPLGECVDYCHSFEEPGDIKRPEIANYVFQPCSEEDTMASNMDIIVANHMGVDDYNIEKPVSPTDPSSLSIDIAGITSAMKGSRQRQGQELKTVSVSWAPDVYDPPVTSRCHSVKANSKKHSKLHKKSLKSKHKSKTIRNGSKVKK